MLRISGRWLTIILGFIILIGDTSRVFAEDFYKGKTIRFIVGNAPGGGYDTYTRAAARHISKYIPGDPVPIVQNRTGGGGLVVANYLYNRAKPDGLTVGIWNSGLILQQVLGASAVKFQADKFGWIGAPVVGLPTCAIMGFTGIKNLQDVMNAKKPIKMGATRLGTTTGDMPLLLNHTLGTKFEVIAGYTGSAPIRLAMQKGEVDGLCLGWESARVTARAMLDAKGDDRMIPFIIQGKSDDPEVRRLPQVTDSIKDQAKLAIYNAWGAQYEFQRPLSLPPGVPKDRLAILRRAYKAALQDPEFLAEAKKSRLIINYVSGEMIDKHVAGMLATPPEARESLSFLVRIRKK